MVKGTGFPEMVKFKAGRYLEPVQMIVDSKVIWLKFKYNKKIIAEVKVMEGAKWHPNVRVWSIKNCSRNWFQLKYLMQDNPYAHYDKPLIEFHSQRPLMPHQIEMVQHALTRHYCIFAAEMGTGKTLAAIEIMEAIGVEDYEAWYIGPKSGVKAVNLELDKWASKVRPRMFTYEKVVRHLKGWNDSEIIPRIAILDESSKIKTPTAQRSQAAMWVAEAIREEYGDEGFVIEMSGTPAPKSPVDWWHQCEVACPGFIREGNIHKFKARLCLIEQRESTITGGVYPHIVTWFDDSNKCKVCGQPKEDSIHSQMAQISGEGHEWVESVNEVERLYKRMKGLVLVQFKKDCLGLPEKRYELVTVKPTVDMIHAAKLITRNSRRAITALTLLRELSDGFQYKDVEVGEKECENCLGTGKVKIKVPKDDINIMEPQEINPEDFIEKEVICDTCGGCGQSPKFERKADVVGSPKDAYFKNELENHEEVGRYIVWGGFQGTIDRLINIALEQGWTVLSVDGRGYRTFSPIAGENPNPNELLIGMDRKHPQYKEIMIKYPKVCFIGHPQAGGMALTLHASPTELFYSNCFNGEARMQAEDRAHRIGMDENRGLIIKDLIMLPTDKLVLDNLRVKKKMQDVTMGELNTAFKELENE